MSIWARIALLFAAAASLAAAGANSYRQNSAAMEPAILVGDEFLMIAISDRQPLERGDIVVVNIRRGPDHSVYHFEDRKDLPATADIKRVVGLPGDTAEVTGGRLIVNGSNVTTAAGIGKYRDINGRETEIRTETLGDRKYRVLDHAEVTRDHGPSTVPPGHCYLLGDNRDFSRDSRVYGTLPIADVVGRVGEIFRSIVPGSGEGRPARVGTTPR